MTDIDVLINKGELEIKILSLKSAPNVRGFQPRISQEGSFLKNCLLPRWGSTKECLVSLRWPNYLVIDFVDKSKQWLIVPSPLIKKKRTQYCPAPDLTLIIYQLFPLYPGKLATRLQCHLPCFWVSNVLSYPQPLPPEQGRLTNTGSHYPSCCAKGEGGVGTD